MMCSLYHHEMADRAGLFGRRKAVLHTRLGAYWDEVKHWSTWAAKAVRDEGRGEGQSATIMLADAFRYLCQLKSITEAEEPPPDLDFLKQCQEEVFAAMRNGYAA